MKGRSMEKSKPEEVKLAKIFLERKGLEIVEKDGFECEVGKADFVAMDGDVLVFVTVVPRSAEVKGMPSLLYTDEYRQEMEAVAGAYLMQGEARDARVRFDAVSVLTVPPDRALIKHSENVLGFYDDGSLVEAIADGDPKLEAWLKEKGGCVAGYLRGLAAADMAVA